MNGGAAPHGSAAASRLTLLAALPVVALLALCCGAALLLGGGLWSYELAFASVGSGQQDLFALDVERRLQVRLTHHPGDDWSPAWSPDGSQLAFLSNRQEGYGIYLLDASSHQVRLLVPGEYGTQLGSLSWSPDGSQLAFISVHSQAFPAVVRVRLNSDGSAGDVTRISSAVVYNADPAWSPDGTAIAFTAQRDGNGELYLLDLDGGEARRLVEHPGWDEYPAWSPDGSSLAFQTYSGGNWEIFALDMHTGSLRNLTQHRARDEQPAWSPDGSFVAFVSGRDISRQVFIMRADGSEQRRVSHRASVTGAASRELEYGSPSWRP